MGLDEVGEHMSIHEAARLAQIVATDPSSATSAALQGWDHPVSREALILMDQFDLSHTAAAGKKVQPHPGRPNKPVDVERKGNAGGRTPAEVKAILQAARDGRL